MNPKGGKGAISKMVVEGQMVSQKYKRREDE